MTKIDGEHLVTDDPNVAVLFLGKRVAAEFGTFLMIKGMGDIEQVELVNKLQLTKIDINVVRPFTVNGDRVDKIRIPRALVREAISSVDGEAAVWELASHGDNEGLVFFAADESEDPIYKEAEKYNWRVVNICQSYGELRKLVEWAREEKG